MSGAGPIRRGAAATALAAAFALPAAGAGRAAQDRPAIGAPFTLASGFQQGYGAGPSALGADGTVWLAQPGFGTSPSSGFEIAARAADGRVLRPIATSDGAGSATDRPAIAATPGRATFVWQTASGFGGSAGTAQVRARSCTLGGCGPIQTLARWSWSARGPLGGSGFTAVGAAEPGVSSAGGNVVAVFYRDGGGRRQMEWTTAGGGGRFGPVHALPGPGGPDPVLSAQAGGDIVAAWIAGDLAAFGHGIEWASWSPRGGFSRPRALAGAGGIDAGLVAAPAGRGVALAWLQGAGASGPVPAAPLWVSRRAASGGFSGPVRVFGGYAVGPSLAGASGMLALAFSAGAGADSQAPAPAWVKRGAGGDRFGRAVDLDARAASHPAVAVDAGGGLLAAWNTCPAPTRRAATCDAKLARARAGAGFGAAVALGAEDRGDAPAVHANGGRTLVTWLSGGAVRGVIVTAP